MIEQLKQKGFVMPTVIMMMVIMALVGYAALVQANNVLNLSYKQAYIQMVRVAAKSGIDYAQEQFNANASYNGTTETTLLNNGRYRVTYKVEVLTTSPDGLEKTVKSTGNLYIPEISTTAKYVFDVRSEVVRTYSASKQPGDFGNLLLWLDASKASSLIKTVSGSVGLTPTPATTFGAAGSSSRDTLEELASNGTQTTNSWQSNDLEMSFCDGAEYSSATCSSSSTRKQYVGMIFQNMAIPKNANILTASLSLKPGSPSSRGSGSAITQRYWGFYNSASNPSPTLFTSGGSNQLKNKYTTAGLRTSSSVDDTLAFSGGAPHVFDIKTIVQEIVDNGNWSSGSNIGITAEWVSGTLSRIADKNDLKLSVTYATTSSATAGNGDNVSKWLDSRGLAGYEAVATHGNVPTKVDNQINGLPVVRFNNGNMLDTLASAATGDEFTVIGVIKPNFTTSSSNGRVVSGMSASQTSDSAAGYAIQALRRNGSGSSGGFAAQYDSSSSRSAAYTCGGSFVCAGTPIVVSSVFTKQSNNTVTATVRQNSTEQATNNFASATTTYTYSIDQLWIGGRRNGAGAGTGQDWLNGDYAELAIYNTQLTCQQLSGIEEYLRAKWAIAASQWSNDCPADNVPII